MIGDERVHRLSLGVACFFVGLASYKTLSVRQFSALIDVR